MFERKFSVTVIRYLFRLILKTSSCTCTRASLDRRARPGTTRDCGFGLSLARPLRPICRHSFPPICQSGRWEQVGAGAGVDGTGVSIARRNEAKRDSGGPEATEHQAASLSLPKHGAVRLFSSLSSLPRLRPTTQNNLFTLSLPHADRAEISIQALASVPLRSVG